MAKKTTGTREALRQLFRSVRLPNEVTPILLIVALVLLGVLFSKHQKLEKEVVSLRHDNQESKKVMDDYLGAMGSFYQEYKETGSLTVQALEATVNRMEDAIAVYDGNVEIYNASVTDLQSRTSALEKRVQAIVDYLQ